MADSTQGYLVPTKQVRVSDLKSLKGERPWAMLTAYDYSSATAFAAAGIECLLVGDSAANVVYGYNSTTRVSFDEMAYLAAGVVRGAGNALVIVDLPFGSYEASDEQAVRSATEMLHRSGAHMVKLEGGKRMASRINALKQAGLAVCAHVGFTPQSVDGLGGFKVQGRVIPRHRFTRMLPPWWKQVQILCCLKWFPLSSQRKSPALAQCRPLGLVLVIKPTPKS